MKTIDFKVRNDRVAVLTIDLPGRSVNVFTPDFIADLDTAMERVFSDDAIVGAILTSGKKEFIVGADLTELVTRYERGISAAEGSHLFDLENRIMRRMETGGKPVACAINGLALGGGFEIALACHWRVMASDGKAQLGLPEVSVGLLPAGGGTQRLPRLIGIEQAMPMLLQGQPLNPAQALELGLVQALAPQADIVELAAQWVVANPGAQQPWDVKGFKVPGGSGCGTRNMAQCFQFPTSINRRQSAGRMPAPLAILSSVYEGTQLPFDRGLRIEAQYFGQLIADPVARNLMRTLFIRKGEANKLVRRPWDISASKVTRLGVLGAGMMGSGIAYSAALAGIQVVLLDTDQTAAERGRDYSRKLLDKELARGRRSEAQVEEILARIQPTSDFDALTGCELVIEAVFEDREVKAGVIAVAETCLNGDAIIASNTSTLAITSLAARSSRPASFIGMHFFSPVERMPLVEVIMGEQTSPQALARTLDLVAQLKKTPIVVNDGPGFYTTRVFSSYVDEGMQMIADGIKPALIENAARLAAMPVGPLAVVDETSLELRWKVILQARKDDLDDRFAKPAGCRVLERMVQLGRLGRKAGAGFYDYPQDAKKQLWSDIGNEFRQAEKQPPVEELVERLLCIQALTAAQCMAEGVLVNAWEGDLGSILGVGFPAWTGGTLSYIDTLGVCNFVQRCQSLAERHGARFNPPEWLLDKAERNEKLVTTPGLDD